MCCCVRVLGNALVPNGRFETTSLFTVPKAQLLNWLTSSLSQAENDYYGTFNSLLSHPFPLSEYYQVAPQRVADSSDSTTIFVVKLREVPVLFVDVQTHVACDSDRVRKLVDEKMRNKLLDSARDNMLTPVLHGPSAFGTHFRVYEYTAEGRSLPPDHCTDTPPRDAWHLNILDPEGEARLKEVVGHINRWSPDFGH
ncbi:hypothetical protein EDD16DRAFT_1517020 [Pisolithus croceorrhizus]|nr:hypothetical protein EV401DRAFT_1895288 [Pisolithus croceorrhizus]KAI6125891.1 hypothetical protein EDD16DRAFT_1517020 [Pisolithus croceorrhizus]KAI6160402.1 hypothetical protein EDD17DRAFT_1510500 [Pisolithus thermaeus]